MYRAIKQLLMIVDTTPSEEIYRRIMMTKQCMQYSTAKG